MGGWGSVWLTGGLHNIISKYSQASGPVNGVIFTPSDACVEDRDRNRSWVWEGELTCVQRWLLFRITVLQNNAASE